MQVRSLALEMEKLTKWLRNKLDFPRWSWPTRAYHATHDSPKIFDDFVADSLFTPEEHTQTDQAWTGLLQYTAPELATTNPDPATALAWVAQLGSGPLALARSRYTEDSPEETIRKSVRQYIILGAGLDTFAYRHPDLADRLQVFELDHPATQAIKRERVAATSWNHPANLHFVPTDFAQESLVDALGRSAYDRNQRFVGYSGVMRL